MSKQNVVYALAKLLFQEWVVAGEVGIWELLKPYLPDTPSWTQEQITEALARLLAEIVVEGWDKHGAPGVARHPTEEGRWVGSFEGPGGPYIVEAPSRREAYMEARREWVYRLLTQG
jgi:hypothetical protein